MKVALNTPVLKRRVTHDSFCAANEIGTFRTEGKKIKLPVIGRVRMQEYVRFSGKMNRVTISRVADGWFASIMIEAPNVAPVNHTSEVVGVDLGIGTLATLSQGNPVEGPKAPQISFNTFAPSRKQNGSSNRHKAKEKLARLYARIANIQKDTTHKATTILVKSKPINALA